MRCESQTKARHLIKADQDIDALPLSAAPSAQSPSSGTWDNPAMLRFLWLREHRRHMVSLQNLVGRIKMGRDTPSGSRKPPEKPPCPPGRLASSSSQLQKLPPILLKQLLSQHLSVKHLSLTLLLQLNGLSGSPPQSIRHINLLLSRDWLCIHSNPVSSTHSTGSAQQKFTYTRTKGS